MINISATSIALAENGDVIFSGKSPSGEDFNLTVPRASVGSLATSLLLFRQETARAQGSISADPVDSFSVQTVLVQEEWKVCILPLLESGYSAAFSTSREAARKLAEQLIEACTLPDKYRQTQ